MNMKRRKALLLPLVVASAFARAKGRPMIVGSYDLPRMKAMKGLTFPRVHLYDASGKLLQREAWPSELANLKEVAGDAFCCVSDKPAPPGSLGPPSDCKIVVYGEIVKEHFDGLRDSRGGAIAYSSLPKHKYLIVEYYAAWCAPCIPARRALEAFLPTPAASDYVALVVDFTRLDPGK